MHGLQKIFSEISSEYEPLNHFFTFGIDRLWRKKVVQMALSEKSTICLDVCSGTGELAELIIKRSSGKLKVFASDFSKEMMEIARRKPGLQKVTFVTADSDNLPFSTDTFDFIVAGFAGRNLKTSKQHLTSTLREFYRVLKPGGRFINLETSQPDLKLIKRLFHFYIKWVVRPLGYLLTGSRGAYSYLSQSIISFYNPKELGQIFLDAGFKEITYKKLLTGIAAIHTGLK